MDATYIFLQQYWWVVISLLGALLVFLLFVQGGQTFIPYMAKNELERTMMVNSMGRKWEFTFTTLVVFGAGFFASFPLFYSTSFGGAYWVWYAVLLCFVIQAVSYEYRTKPRNVLGQKTFEAFLFINGVLGPLLLGTAVGTFFTGSDFYVGKMNLTDPLQPVISHWGSAWHGLEAVTDYRNVLLGLAVCFLARVLGLLFYINSIRSAELIARMRRVLIPNTIVFLLTFLGFLAAIFLSEGYAVAPETGVVSLVPYKYFMNLIQMPVVLVIFLLGVVGVLLGIAKGAFTKSVKGIWYAGVGTICAVFALFCLAGFNGTAYYPSSSDLQSSLTIYNSSSSKFTLSVMAVVTLLLPVVVWYIWKTWRALSRKPITPDEVEVKQTGASGLY